MEELIRNLRIKIDGISQLVNHLYIPNPPIPGEIKSSTINESYDSLILAKAWLGKILGILGQETPYKNDGKRKTIEDIEETADTYRKNRARYLLFETTNKVLIDNILTQKDWENKSYIEKIDWLREEIKDIIDNTEDFSQKYPDVELEQGWVYKYLSEARFYLGFELGRIRDEK